METHKSFCLTKSERIHSRTAVELLFSGKKSSIAIYPLRAVWIAHGNAEGMEHGMVRILVSVPKKRLRHAVDRNRIKRQIREAFRLNKHILYRKLCETNRSVDIAFVCIANKPVESTYVHKSVVKSLLHIADCL